MRFPASAMCRNLKLSYFWGSQVAPRLGCTFGGVGLCATSMDVVRKMGVFFQNCRKGAEQAFSLMELLVVIAVISIVAALLLPVVANAKRSALLAKCTSNLHQLGLAGEMYWDDSGGAA